MSHCHIWLGPPRQGQHEDTGEEYVSAADERPLEQRERIVGSLVRRQHLAHAHHHQKTGRPPIAEQMIEDEVRPGTRRRGVPEIDHEVDEHHTHQCKAPHDVDR
jgi:hypothetical protein